MHCTIEDLFGSFKDNLRGFIASRTRNAQLADDLLQETFVRITRYCRSGCDCTHPKSFLYKVAASAIADHFRAARRRASEKMPQTAEDNNMNQEVLACLVPLIDSLPLPYREAVRLADIEQVPQQEIARRMGVSLSGAKSRVQRGRAKLRDMLLAMCDLEHDSYGNILDCRPRD